MSMETTRTSGWSQRIDLPAADRMRVRFFIEQETAYLNGLINGFGGPMRTMPEVLRNMTGRWEALYGLAASHGLNPVNARPSGLPLAFKPYADLISTASVKQSLLFEIAAQPATLAHGVRRAMAVEVLRHARIQGDALSQPLQDGTYRSLVEVLSPMEVGQKRHVQVPRSEVRLSGARDEASVSIQFPYLNTKVDIVPPNFAWTTAILREDEDGGVVLELVREEVAYNPRRVDAAGPRRRKRKNAAR